MSTTTLYPQYVSRSAEQRRILAQVAEVKESGLSRAVLLYGLGGVGKTRMVREFPKIDETPQVIWLEPIDVDDSQHWLLSNLEQRVADELDPGRRYFAAYHEYVSELPRHRLMSASRETVLDYLNRIKVVFTQCYEKYIRETGNTVVMTFDTVEAIRGMHFLRTLTRWMKALPQTLFILAGRSMPGPSDAPDPILASLEDPPLNMNVSLVSLGNFSAEDSRRYLSQLGDETDLSEEEAEKFIHLTQGNPLWLAFTVDYLAEFGMPEEAEDSLEQIKAELPYHGVVEAAGREVVESFKRRLVAPYKEADFWHEAIKRLAVVRESISQPIWQQLMADQPLPADVTDLDQAWAELKDREWIRLRANERFVTLHDAVAEELAQRVIRLNDTNLRWRQQLWQRAVEIYTAQARELEAQLADAKSAVDSRLQSVGTHDITEVDRRQRELNELKAVQLLYQLLSDPRQGVQRFVELFRQARNDHDVLFEDLLAFQMQRFIPGRAAQSTLNDTVGMAIDSLRHWLSHDGQDSYIYIGLEIADYFIDREQPEAAANLLDQLPVPTDQARLYKLRKLQGNASVRIPGRVREGGRRFEEALAESSQLRSPDQYRTLSNAYKELGFYYRSVGHWGHADAAYEAARNAISQAPISIDPEADREEMASILTNWAYLKGIGGKYDDAINMIESAITVRRDIKKRREQAISCSVKGEVLRYNREFRAAWEVYAEAEELFGETSWSWLGVIYQEQAICLFQSIPAAVQLIDPPEDPLKRAEALISSALDLCRTHNARYYPSALNRAGRIFGFSDPDRGLGYLKEGTRRARDISDGWFWLANIIQYAELCYSTWEKEADPKYLDLIPAMTSQLQEAAAAELDFRELRGRWRVLQGHLSMRKVLNGDNSMLDAAFGHYKDGFPLIMQGWVGSYGAAAIPGEFGRFRDLVLGLPPEIRAQWKRELARSWSGYSALANVLLARLEELK